MRAVGQQHVPELVGDGDGQHIVQRRRDHPNIGAIYGLEESSGVTALVLELVSRLIYFASDRGGVPNVWAIGFDLMNGVAVGERS